MMKQGRLLAEFITLNDLEIDGVTIVFKKHTKRVAGEYSFISHGISIREELKPYWFATFATVHHEYGHHQQRFLIYAYFIAAIITSVGVYIYNNSQSYNPLLYLIVTIFCSIPIIVAVAILNVFHFEQDADRFMINRLPDTTFLFLSQIEIVEVAQAMGRENLLRSLMALHEYMQVHFLDWLGDLSIHS